VAVPVPTFALAMGAAASCRPALLNQRKQLVQPCLRPQRVEHF